MRSNRLEDPRDEAGATPAQKRLLRVLFLVAAVLAAGILAGTVYGLATGSRARKLAREALEPRAAAGQAILSLGTLRASTADKPAALVVATIAFPYPGDERVFKEELQKKAPALKAAAISWFSRRGAAELHPAYEGAVKAALRDAFNELLSLGELGEIWLSDFAVIQ